MRDIIFRALFKHILTGKTVWYDVVVNYSLKNIEGYIQVSPWLQYTGLKDSSKKWLKKEDQQLYEVDLVQVIDWEVESIGTYKVGDNIDIAGKNFKVLKVEKHPHSDYEKRAEVYYYLSDRIREITYDNEVGFLPMQESNNEHGWGEDASILVKIGNRYDNPELISKILKYFD